MIPVDYELHRQYQYERLSQAATCRRLRQATGAAHMQGSHHLRVPTARQARTWITTMLGLVPRRIWDPA